MNEYQVIGADAETGAPAEMVVRAASVPDAAAHAERRGISPSEVRTPSKTYSLNDQGGWVIAGVSTPKRTGSEKAERWLMVFSLLIPLVGFIVGGIRLSRGDQSGVVPIVLGIIGMIVAILLQSGL